MVHLYICCWQINCGVAITLSIFTRIITTDTPWLIHRGDTCGIISEFIIWLMFRVITPQQRHTFARPQGQYIGCPLWVQIRINVLHRTRTLITDTSWLVRKGDTWGVPFEFKIWLIYYTTKGSSQKSHHSSSLRAIHGVSPVGSNSDWCIISLHDPHSLQPMARPWVQYITVILLWVIYVKAWRLARAEW